MAQFDRNAQSAGDADVKTSADEILHPGKAFALAGAAAQGLMRGNLEVLSLASRRARVQLDLPTKVMACRNANDVGQLAVCYWRDAFQDYLDFNQRLMANWTQSMSEVGQGALARTAAGMANVALQPLATVAAEAGSAIADHPTEPWAWWRTDLKGIKPIRNGHHRELHDQQPNA